MITENEKQATLLSPTKKDYYQIWNELLELASKISDRWTPSETNESDPGIILLKVLTACADKLNYNIDKNILEAYMPSAAQEESMRKLCEMMGYNMKYYRSATTDVTIYYNGDVSSEFQSGEMTSTKELILPKFTQITNVDNDINYLTLAQISFNIQNTTNTVNCIEGTLNYCAEENNRIVTINNIDDNYRYYLPVNQIAENGIFIYNILDEKRSEEWTQVDNLNTVALGKSCYKFGYDSKEMLPYIQFPDDIANIIGDGLVIAYVITNGVNGNINAKTLSTFTAPTDWGSTDVSDYNKTGISHANSEFTCYNVSASTNGYDRESLEDAYKNFKKTVGTFDTLITCRDYMNKIYELTKSENDTTPLVSNSIVSDIRDDINKSSTICSFNEFGINYVDRALTEPNVDIKITGSLPYPSATYYNKTVQLTSSDNTIKYYKCVKVNNDTYWWGEIEPDTIQIIDNFDLILYPFKTVYNLNTKAEHDNSFKYDKTVYNDIAEQLEDSKTISHKLNLPKESADYPLNSSDIVLIKNYLRLNAKLTTTSKVNPAEQSAIKSAIKTALYTKFNLRQLDFGEEIPFDDILETIQSSDVRIKNIALDEPVLYTRFLLADNSEYDTAVGYGLDEESYMKAMMSAAELKNYNDATDKDSYRKNRVLMAKKLYNKLALRNILAGRLNLFKYDTEFIPSVSESKSSYELIYPIPTPIPTTNDTIKYITSELQIKDIPNSSSSAQNIVLKENQIVQFSAPNFKTIVTYPAYVNYFISLKDVNDKGKKAIPATFMTLYDYMNENSHAKFIEFMNSGLIKGKSMTKIETQEMYNSYVSKYGCVFNKESSAEDQTYAVATGFDSSKNQYSYQLTKESYTFWYSWIKTQETAYSKAEDKHYLTGLYKNLGADMSRVIGKMVDTNHNKYQLDYTGLTTAEPMSYYFVQETHEKDEASYTKDGFGRDAKYAGLTANSEYQLKKDEYLCINYTNAESEADTSALESGGETSIKTTSEVINVYYGAGTIIKPNSQLIDSMSRRESGKSWAKTDGYDFSKDLGLAWKEKVPGMYSLGANEQIEIRDIVKVQIYDNTDYSKVYVYFKLNNEATSGKIEFLKPESTEDIPRYTLEEGEYFWYTDKNKTTLTYCGNGCEIVNYTGEAIVKDADVEEISVEKINEYGIKVIPWIALTNLKYGSGTSNKYIEWIEYQYITLIHGDTLKYVTSSSTSSSTSIGPKKNKM